jgi:GNAT superfamily N-acetyltransferase
MTTIRQATTADVDALLDMSTRFLAESAYRRLLAHSPTHLRALIALVLDLGAVFVADVDGELVGMIAIMVLPHPMSGQRRAEELAWWVAPAHRAGTIGPRLLRAAEVWARQQDGTYLQLAVPIGQPRLAAFLERRGYVALETVFVRPLT